MAFINVPLSFGRSGDNVRRPVVACAVRNPRACVTSGHDPAARQTLGRMPCWQLVHAHVPLQRTTRQPTFDRSRSIPTEPQITPRKRHEVVEFRTYLSTLDKSRSTNTGQNVVAGKHRCVPDVRCGYRKKRTQCEKESHKYTDMSERNCIVTYRNRFFFSLFINIFIKSVLCQSFLRGEEQKKKKKRS